jgi:hypothetical protein
MGFHEEFKKVSVARQRKRGELAEISRRSIVHCNQDQIRSGLWARGIANPSVVELCLEPIPADRLKACREESGKRRYPG